MAVAQQIAHQAEQIRTALGWVSEAAETGTDEPPLDAELPPI